MTPGSRHTPSSPVPLDRLDRRPVGTARSSTARDRFLPVLVTASTLLRLPGFVRPPSSDEAGFLLVARAWDPTATSLYGAYWVDRPPVLIYAYRVADALAGSHGPRLLAAWLAAVLVVAVHHLARELAGVVPARVASLATVALLAHPALTAWTAKGEVLGTPLVVVSALAAVRAVRPAGSEDDDDVRHRARLAVAAGLCAVLAVGFKQSLLGGLVFGAVLLVGSCATGRLGPRAGLHLAGHAALGAALPVIAVAAWVVVGPAHLDTAWFQIVGFRADASQVLTASDSRAPVERAWGLWHLFVGSGMAALAVVALLTGPRWLRSQGPVGAALVAMTLADVAGVVLGGSYWHAYLIPLVPDLALLTALAWTTGTRPRWALRVVATLVAGSAALTLGAFAHLPRPGDSPTWDTGRSIASVAEPGDTIVSLYGSPEVVAASGLPSPYEHLWTLPMRTLDPDLVELRRIIAGPDAPTWLVVALPLDSWHIDPDSRLRDLVARRYRLVQQPCGELMVWQRGDSGYRVMPPVDCGVS